MSDYEERLQQCFAAVFPGLDAVELRDASISSVAEWDSVANINLLCVVEEEFGIEIAPGDLEQLTSFTLILRYLGMHDQ
jgi:acyl carrier protein